MVALSVIIPCYNEEQYLPLLLTSLREQFFKDFEIIVSDAGSTDRSQEIAKSFGCRVIIKPPHFHGHPGKERNRGALHAKGTFLVFMDADGYVNDRFFLDTIARHFKFHPNSAIGCKHVWNSTFPIRAATKIQYLAHVLFQNTSPLICGYMIATSKVNHETIQGFNEELNVGEDVDYARRLHALSDFKVLRNICVFTSPRRFENEGFYYILKGIYLFFHYQTKGAYVPSHVEYGFQK